MTKQRLIKNINRISNMTLQEVMDYRVSVSTSSADSKAKSFMYKACDERLKQVDTLQALAVNGDLDDID